jgi:UDP-N-acetylmuramate--alanine ligase
VTGAADAPLTEQGVSLERAHLVGVGGAGMSGIAHILADRGFAVSGSDARDSTVLAGLAERGVRTAVGHAAANLSLTAGGPTAVVVSTAVRPDNPEVTAARAAGIPVVRRADALAALMTGRRSVCVAGTHGKTSTTSMLTVALQHAGLDPSFAIGGELTGSGLGAHHGHDDVFVAEADESDGSFLSFSPHGAIVTNIEPDHLDHHGTAEAYIAVFDQFVDRIEPGGFLVICADDPGAAALAARVRLRRLVSYGRSESAVVRLVPDPSGPGHTVVLADGARVPLRLAVPGDHMLLNAVAALAAGVELGVDADLLAAGLAGYTGVRRRFELKGVAAEVTVYDDYAHHPTEVAAQLAAARGVVPAGGRLVVVFQPHLYSRTATFAAEFGAVLAAADLVVVLDVYGAREDPRPGVTGEVVAAAVPAGPVVHYHPDRSTAARFVADTVLADDLVITMGAGDVTAIGPELLALLADSGADSTEGG